MVEARKDLDYGRDDQPANDDDVVEGEGFTMVEVTEVEVVADVDAGTDEAPADREVNPEASTYGAP